MLRQLLIDRFSSLTFGPIPGFPAILLALLAIWTIFWKGMALWKSAKNNQKYWFVALLIVGTAGIMEILYLAFFQRKRK